MSTKVSLAFLDICHFLQIHSHQSFGNRVNQTSEPLSVGAPRPQFKFMKTLVAADSGLDEQGIYF